MLTMLSLINGFKLEHERTSHIYTDVVVKWMDRCTEW